MHELIDKLYFRSKREALIRELQGKVSEPTLKAMSEIPRHLFVAPPLLASAYVNKVLPIREKLSWHNPLGRANRQGTSLSRPLVVGEMTDFLDLQPTDSVLEIGTATGYQAAVISKLARRVTTVDVFEDLCVEAKKRLDGLGINNVDVVVADGSIPFTERGFFDKIIVTASVPPVPPYHPLLELLTPGGLAVIPLGGFKGEKALCCMISIRASEDGYQIEHREPGYIFVSMEGGRGWDAFFRSLTYTFHQRYIR